MVRLGTHLHGLGYAGCSHWCDHDFLEGHGVTGVYTAIEDVEEGDRYHIW